MDNQQPSPTAGTPIYQDSQEKNAKWLWILIVLIIIGALAFAFYKKIGPFARFASSEESVVSPSPFSFSESSSTPSPEATVGANLDKSEPKVRVLNGTNTSGLAATAKEFLETKGYTVSAIGNAVSRDFETTKIRFKKGFEKFESVLKADLSSKYSVSISSDALEASDSADIEIIVGSK